MVYSIVFGITTALDWQPIVTITIVSYASVVGISQALLFGGRDPRLASGLAGSLCMCGIVVIQQTIIESNTSFLGIANSLLIGAFMGLIVGYLVGACVGGIFLVADFLRRGRGVMES